jgi:hypothetical protein
MPPFLLGLLAGCGEYPPSKSFEIDSGRSSKFGLIVLIKRIRRACSDLSCSGRYFGDYMPCKLRGDLLPITVLDADFVRANLGCNAIADVIPFGGHN